MTWREYRFLVRSDLYRLTGRTDAATFFRQITRGIAFKFSFWMRTCRYTARHPLHRLVAYRIAKFFYYHYTFKFGISIPWETRIGSGFYIGHFGGIVVNERSVIGKNCNISQGVTLGESNRGHRQGYPVIGDNVYIGPGAKIIGAVKIGDYAAVGANCVVTKDVPDHGVAVGIPVRVISLEGSAGFVNLTDYE
jgi:serine O-acetyltransferase